LLQLEYNELWSKELKRLLATAKSAPLASIAVCGEDQNSAPNHRDKKRKPSPAPTGKSESLKNMEVIEID
jgi:hypothetical protein